MNPTLAGALYTLDRQQFFKDLIVSDDPSSPEFSKKFDILLMNRSYYTNFMYQASKINDPVELTHWLLLNARMELCDTGLDVFMQKIFYVWMDAEDTVKTTKKREGETGQEVDMHESNLIFQQECSNFIHLSQSPMFINMIKLAFETHFDRYQFDSRYDDPSDQSRLRVSEDEILYKAFDLYIRNVHFIKVPYVDNEEAIVDVQNAAAEKIVEIIESNELNRRAVAKRRAFIENFPNV